jgi:hypothetical protein
MVKVGMKGGFYEMLIDFGVTQDVAVLEVAPTEQARICSQAHNKEKVLAKEL